MTENMFQDPPQPGRFTPAEWLGHLLLCEPQRYLENVLTQNGPSDTVEGTITVLTAPGGPHVIVGARVFQGQLIASLREAIGGRPVLGRLGQGQAQPGRSPAWILTATSPEDKQYAGQYLQQRQAQQFAEPTPGHPVATTPGPGPSNQWPTTPVSQSQPQGYGAPSPADQQWATQQQYAPPATAPTPAPAPPAAAPTGAPPPLPVTPAGPVAQATAQPPAPAGALSPEQLDALPPEVRKMIVGQGSDG